METLDLKVLEYENDEYANINGTSYQGVIPWLLRKTKTQMIIFTKCLPSTTGKMVAFPLKSMSGISVVKTTKQKRLQMQFLKTT